MKFANSPNPEIHLKSHLNLVAVGVPGGSTHGRAPAAARWTSAGILDFGLRISDFR